MKLIDVLHRHVRRGQRQHLLRFYSPYKPLRPRSQQRSLASVNDLQVENPAHRLEPEQEGAEHDVDVADGVATEEGVAAGALGEGHFHVLDGGERLLRLLRPLLLRLGLHHAVPRWEQLRARRRPFDQYLYHYKEGRNRNVNARACMFVPCRRRRQPRSEQWRARRGRLGGSAGRRTARRRTA